MGRIINEFVERNRRLLTIYCVAARIIGRVLLVVPGIIIVVEALRGELSGDSRLLIPMMVRVVVLNFIFLGLLVLGVGQFIRYVFETQSRARWILRHGDKILYLYAALVVLGAVWQWVFTAMAVKSTVCAMFFPFLVSWLLPATAKALILIGLGQVLRRVLPVIEESKTLV